MSTDLVRRLFSACCLITLVGCGDRSSNKTSLEEQSQPTKTGQPVVKQQSKDADRTIKKEIKTEVTKPAPWKDEANAIAAIEKAGGKVVFDMQDPKKPVIEVDLGFSRANPESLIPLKDLNRVRTLNLRSCKLMSLVQRITKDGTTETDTALEPLKALTSLEQLDLEGAVISDAGIASLKVLTALRVLVLDNTRISDNGLMYLKGLVKLQFLHLRDNSITDRGLVHLKGFTELRHLDLGKNVDVTDAGLKHLKGLTNIQVLILPNGIADKELEGLKQSLPKAKITIGF